VIITPSLIPVLHAISSFQRARLVKPQNSMWSEIQSKEQKVDLSSLKGCLK
jgi:hypothetical protein